MDLRWDRGDGWLLKKALLIGVWWGIVTVVGLAVVVGTYIWYDNRPKPPVPPKPWNLLAIKADYDYAYTEGDNNNIIVYYTLENTTDFDYRVEDGQNVLMSAKLKNRITCLRSAAVEEWTIPFRACQETCGIRGSPKLSVFRKRENQCRHGRTQEVSAGSREIHNRRTEQS